ncbi:MAG: T9SS type A sorting domain-containing protein [Adhaeribacter sp.]
MKHNLLRLTFAAFLLGLFNLQVQTGFAQIPKPTDKEKYKASAVLRDLANPPINIRSRQAPTKPQKLDLLQIKDGYVAIDAVADGPDGQELLSQLQQLGLKNGVFYKRIVSGYFPIDKIDELEKVQPLRMVSPAYKLQRSGGAVTTQGDAALLTDEARQKFNVTGVGSKIGIISDSYGSDPAGVAAGIASGDLPSDVQVLLDAEDETDEGRGMAELIHDVAPGAKLAFHTAVGGQATFATGILRLAQAGCNIMVDDVIYPGEPMFQDGIIAQAVDVVVKNNITYFSAAGNNNRQSYQAAFRNSGRAIVLDSSYYGEAHDFGNGDITQTIRIPAGGTFQIPFQWDDPFYSVSGGSGARTDLDVLVFFNGEFLPDLSSTQYNVGGDPLEFVGISNPFPQAIDIEIMITKFEGPNPSIMKWVEFGESTPQEHNTKSSTIYGHSNAQNAIAVGASAWFNTPPFNANVARPVINNFSSAGGTPVIYTLSGARLPLNNSSIRKKPEVVGPDGGNTTFFGDDITIDTDIFPNFFGTSAAAPHVAAVAALMQETRRNSLAPAAILANLISSTIDMDDPLTPGFDVGFDYQTGYGFVQATKALETTRTYGCNISLTTQVTQATPTSAGAINLTVSGGTGSYTYRWNSGTLTEDLPKASPGQYTVWVTDATGCTATTTVQVGVTGTPLTLTSAHTNVSAYGAQDGSIDLSVVGGVAPYTFKWNAGVTTEDLPRVTRGLYTVWVTDAAGNSAYTAVFVSAKNDPLALHTAHNPASRLGANDGSVDLTVIGGVAPYTYRWNAGVDSEDLPRATPGLYTVTVTDATGASVTTSVYVSVKGQPLALRAAHTDASAWGKPDGAIDLTIMGGLPPYKIRWNAGSEMEDLPQVTPGFYTVTVTDAKGTTATLTVQVGVRGTVPVLTARQPDANLEYNSIKKTSLTAYPNPVAGQANIALTLSQDGDYSLAVYDLKGSIVKTLQQGKARAGQVVETVWEPQTGAKGLYILRLKTQHEVQNLRLMVN